MIWFLGSLGKLRLGEQDQFIDGMGLVTFYSWVFNNIEYNLLL